MLESQDSEEKMEKKTILVIDDSLTARMKVKETLEEDGKKVIVAENAIEGGKRALEINPDVIVLDVVLPDIEGIELCKSWRSNPDLKNIPVLLISGERSGSSDRVAGLEAGALGYVAKPFKENEFLAQINMLCELARAQKKLKEQVEIANAANASKSNFLATVSHEIRTPLTAIIGFAETLLEPDLSNKMRINSSNTIIRNGHHLIRVINDILDFSKIEAGKEDLELREYSVFHGINSVATLMKPKAEEKAISFDVIYKGQIPEQITTDSTKFKQILLNLVSNSIKFTEKGSVSIEVSCDVKNEQLYIKVIDTGIGMNEEQRSKLFKAFSQADSSTTRKYGGTGLGLVISEKFSILLGGGVSVASVPGQGSTFTINISTGSLKDVRILDTPPSDEELRLVKPVKVMTEPDKLSGKVLLAEDGEDNQRLIGHYLKKLGLEATIVNNGQTAINTATEGEFDLVLMDVNMPVLDGLEATKQLREQGYSVPIIALTAHTMSHHVKMCLDAGCTDHLGKPFCRDDFFSKMTEYCDKSDENEQNLSPIVPEDVQNVPEMFEVLQGFIDNLPKRITEIEEAFGESSWLVLERAAHRMVCAEMFGYPQLTEVSRALESAASVESVDDTISLIEDLKLVVKRIEAGKDYMIQDESSDVIK